MTGSKGKKSEERGENLDKQHRWRWSQGDVPDRQDAKLSSSSEAVFVAVVRVEDLTKIGLHGVH